MSTADYEASWFLGLSAPYFGTRGPGGDVLWPLVGMGAYAVMVRVTSTHVDLRGPVKVRTALVQMYNIAVIAMSFAIFVPTLYFRLRDAESVRVAYCPSGPISGGMKACLLAYHLSKYVEYADTALLVLKGKPVGTLHYWHHLVVTFTSWTWYRSEIAWMADGVLFNTFVHCVMYYYYYLAGSGRPPWWKKYVTTLQIVQFVSSFCFLSVWAYFHATVGCRHVRVIAVAAFFNAWLLFMFINFYSKSYKKA